MSYRSINTPLLSPAYRPRVRRHVLRSCIRATVSQQAPSISSVSSKNCSPQNLFHKPDLSYFIGDVPRQFKIKPATARSRMGRMPSEANRLSKLPAKSESDGPVVRQVSRLPEMNLS